MTSLPVHAGSDDAPLAGKVAVVTGASRGFGDAIAHALAAGGARVTGVARSFSDDEHEPKSAGQSVATADSFTALRGDVTDRSLAQQLMGDLRPDIVVLNAGARPPTGELSAQSWESFSANWNVDTRHVFEWTTAALRLPLHRGAVVICVSSGAAIGGSPLSGGYAPAKAAIRFLRNYAEAEADRAALGIRFVTLLPQLTPSTGLGQQAVEAYAEYNAVSVEEYVNRLGPPLSPHEVGQAALAIVLSTEPTTEYLLSGHGLRPLPTA